MIIVREIDFSRARELNQIKEISKKFDSILKNNPNGKMSKKGSISALKYFFVIECNNSLEKFGMFDFFINTIKKENKKGKKNVSKSKPDIFDKLGEENEVKACYIVATTKTKIDSISTRNSTASISLKLNFDNLPEEIEEMCEEYSDFVKERDEIMGISRMFEEMMFKPLDFLPSIDSINNFHQSGNSKAFKIEDIIEDNIDEVSNIKFLNSLLSTALESENYELCAKIRDRINEISQNQKNN